MLELVLPYVIVPLAIDHSYAMYSMPAGGAATPANPELFGPGQLAGSFRLITGGGRLRSATLTVVVDSQPRLSRTRTPSSTGPLPSAWNTMLELVLPYVIVPLMIDH